MLLEAYRRFWKGRSSAERVSAAGELFRRISDDLDDRLTHPRLRKSREDKLRELEERIAGSSLTEEQKEILADAYRSSL